MYVALLVSDQDEALDFYTNVLGFEKGGGYPTPAGPRFLTVGVGGQDFVCAGLAAEAGKRRLRGSRDAMIERDPPA